MAVKTRRNESSSRDSNIKKGKLSMKRNKQKKKIAVLDSLTGEDALSLLKILAERDAKLARTIVDAASELLGTVEPSGLAQRDCGFGNGDSQRFSGAHQTSSVAVPGIEHPCVPASRGKEHQLRKPDDARHSHLCSALDGARFSGKIDFIPAQCAGGYLTRMHIQPNRAVVSRQSRMDRATPGCLAMKPRRSSICII